MRIKTYIPLRFRQFFANIWDRYNLKRNYYNDSSIDEATPMVVYMCDGRSIHGGLSDRLSGLISTYDYCKTHNRIFKIYWNFPYQLEDFLEPNEYNWIVDKRELSYSCRQTSVLRLTIIWDIWKQRKYADKQLDKHHKQIHVYTNMKYFFPCNFKYLFKELFKPSKILDEAINAQLKYFNSEYVSITFRFQQLLGDFKEGNYPTINDIDSKNRLVKRCLFFIEAVQRRHPEIEKILVTSDSVTFLNEALKYDFVHIIPGKVVHVDNDGKASGTLVHLKSFVDLFMIANAKKIYNIVYPPLYHTTFPMLASYIYGKEYEEITEDIFLDKEHVKY